MENSNCDNLKVDKVKSFCFYMYVVGICVCSVNYNKTFLNEFHLSFPNINLRGHFVPFEITHKNFESYNFSSKKDQKMFYAFNVTTIQFIVLKDPFKNREMTEIEYFGT